MSEAHIVANLINSFRLLLPETVLVVASCVVFLGGTIRSNRQLWAVVTVIALALAATMMLWTTTASDFPRNSFVSPLDENALAYFTRWFALGAGLILVLVSWHQISDLQAGDYYGCLLIVLAGLSITGIANDLITLFLALEMISIPTYIMLYLPKHDAASQESALKYFMLSIFSSALLLFGFSYLYGLCGSTNLAVIMQTLGGQISADAVPPIALVAVIMIIAGLGFRITAVPFHFYAPDVYQGAATVMAAFLAVVPKAAGFVALLRVFGFVLPVNVTARVLPIGTFLSDQIPLLLWFLAALTMFIGNVLALLQDNLKRMLAYSSVAHAGYMLIALATAPFLQQQGSAADGIDALLYYLVAYGVMTGGTFAVLAYIHTANRPVETVDDLAGLSQTNPLIALLMTVFLFSLIGIPFTAGFTGKLMIFMGAIGVTSPGHVWIFRALALIGVINAAIGAWYYLRLIAVMYLRTSIQPIEKPQSVPGFAAILLCAILTVALSIPPGVNWLLNAARDVGAELPQPIAHVSTQ